MVVSLDTPLIGGMGTIGSRLQAAREARDLALVNLRRAERGPRYRDRPLGVYQQEFDRAVGRLQGIVNLLTLLGVEGL